MVKDVLQLFLFGRVSKIGHEIVYVILWSGQCTSLHMYICDCFVCLFFACIYDLNLVYWYAHMCVCVYVCVYRHVCALIHKFRIIRKNATYDWDLKFEDRKHFWNWCDNHVTKGDKEGLVTCNTLIWWGCLHAFWRMESSCWNVARRGTSKNHQL